MTEEHNIPRPTRDMFPDGPEGDALYSYMIDLVSRLGAPPTGTGSDEVPTNDDLGGLATKDQADITGKTIGDIPEYEDDGSGNPVLDHPNRPLVNGVPVLVAPATSSDPGLAFDAWRTPNTEYPTLVLVSVTVKTDGSSPGRVSIRVDESGDTTPDYRITVCEATNEMSDGADVNGSAIAVVPAGGSYQIWNQSDPKGANSILTHREFNQ